MPWTAGMKTIQETADEDTAAKFFERHNIHHALVVDIIGKVAGLISALGIIKEVAQDARAWLYSSRRCASYILVHGCTRQNNILLAACILN